MNLGSWLRKSPQPRIIVADGKRIEVGNKGGKWRDMVRTIESLGATKLEALDGSGNILRAFTIEDDDDDDAKPASKTEHPHACPTCGTSLNMFAQLLSNAFKTGSDSQRDAYQSIFSENTNLVRLLADRLGALEASQHKWLQTHVRQTVDLAQAKADAALAASNGGDGGDSILGPLIAGVLQGQAAAPAQPPQPPQRPANGKGVRK